MDQKGIIICVSAALLAIAAIYLLKSGNEYYGGPVKNIRKIPMTDCYTLCDRWSMHCKFHDPGNHDACQRRRNSCRAECYYSNSHRMF